MEGTTEDWSGNPLNDAAIIDEAHYPDGQYQVAFTATDYADNSTREYNDVLIDNFRPYVKKVRIQYDMLVEEAVWDWDVAAGRLKLTDFPSIIPVFCTYGNVEYITVTITMSEL